MSVSSTTTACNAEVDLRDTFLGRRCCVICGLAGSAIQHCNIISESSVWRDLKERNWLPSWAKYNPRHEPRNNLLMCGNHKAQFTAYSFFIRFYPNVHKFVLVNYSEDPTLKRFHGKAIALDNRDRYAPFSSLFIIHEMRVRGFNPFQPVSPDMPDDITWQDWILSDGMLETASGTFIRDKPPGTSSSNEERVSAPSQLEFQPTTETTSAGGAPAGTGTRTVALNEDVIADILAATRAMPSWQACVMEGTGWTGTAEENIEKYVSSVGVQESSSLPPAREGTKGSQKSKP